MQYSNEPGTSQASCCLWYHVPCCAPWKCSLHWSLSPLVALPIHLQCCPSFRQEQGMFLSHSSLVVLNCFGSYSAPPWDTYIRFQILMPAFLYVDHILGSILVNNCIISNVFTLVLIVWCLSIVEWIQCRISEFLKSACCYTNQIFLALLHALIAYLLCQECGSLSHKQGAPVS